MVISRSSCILFLITVAGSFSSVFAESPGSIRGVVYDKDFDAPLFEAKVTIVNTSQAVLTSSEGNYLLSELAPDTYTLIFSKEGYIRQVKANVVVIPGKMSEVDVRLEGDYADMEEFIVQDVQLGAGSEAALLELRFEAPGLMDSIGADLMKQAGASDAASALKLVAGASVQDGKYAVVRGLPDRYVNSQMNSVRLPTSDSDKRAVQLDQFPAAVIESMQVSKTFTPDQQGDASGGAVNVVLKSIPEQSSLKLSGGYSYNTNVAGSDFLGVKGDGINTWGKKSNLSYGDVTSIGVNPADSPSDYKWSVSGGGKHIFNDDLKVGVFGSFYYEKDSSFYGDGINDRYWCDGSMSMTPYYTQGSPSEDKFFTKLYDVTRASEDVKWGALGVLGMETENHSLTFVNMYTRAADFKATLAEDTRGKEYYFPGYDYSDPDSEGNQHDDAAPYTRQQTLEYTERTTHTMQLSGKHKFSEIEFADSDKIDFLEPEFDWVLSHSSSGMYQPDKRLFSSAWYSEEVYSFPGFEWVVPAHYSPFKPAETFSLGNLQRVWKEINEDSSQLSMNLKFPFENTNDQKGYYKFGLFYDKVNRTYNQESFSNFGDNETSDSSWDSYWTDTFLNENHPVSASDFDVDYSGKQNIVATYAMFDIPIASNINAIAGARFEHTALSVINYPEGSVKWVPPGEQVEWVLQPGAADVDFSQNDILPSVGFVVDLKDDLVFRTSYSHTVARQTFKELTPINQQEYLGADVFSGNPQLGMASLDNYDIRFDYTPFDDGLFSFSYFHKDVTDPIEYVQKVVAFNYTTAVNYPKGTIDGLEFEFRQKLGKVWESARGLAVGVNATFISSEVELPQSEQKLLKDVGAPVSKRNMSNTPEYLYNLFMTYDFPDETTSFNVFYTFRGDTLIAGATQKDNNFIPDIYEKEYGTLNCSLSHKFSDIWQLSLNAKNLLNPEIETFYRSDYIGSDVTKTSYTKGREYSISLSAKF